MPGPLLLPGNNPQDNQMAALMMAQQQNEARLHALMLDISSKIFGPLMADYISKNPELDFEEARRIAHKSREGAVFLLEAMEMIKLEKK